MATPQQPAGIDARLVGHAIAVLVGVLAIVAGITAMVKGLPGAMSITLIAIGGLLLAMTPYSLRGSRPAWSLLVSILAVFATVTLFGAPTIRKQLGIGLGIALIIPLVQVVAVVALAMIHERYRDD